MSCALFWLSSVLMTIPASVKESGPLALVPPLPPKSSREAALPGLLVRLSWTSFPAARNIFFVI